mgnify:CR=1 FL=1
MFLLDAHFVSQPSKFISGAMYCLSTMVQMETSQVNVLSKMDLLKKDPVQYKRVKRYLNADIEVTNHFSSSLSDTDFLPIHFISDLFVSILPSQMLVPELTEDTGEHLSKLNEVCF